MKKKLLPVILVCCMLSAWLAAYAHADDIVDSGECGDNAHWSLNSAGTLSITGSGAMKDFGWHWYGNSRYSNSPWGTHNSPYLNMITSVTVSNGITVIGSHSFYGLDRLTKVTLPDSLTMINDAAFYCCTSLTKITLPANIARIADYTFAGCSNLLGLTIPENVAGIGDHAFEDCDRLTSIVIPENVAGIGDGAFSNCNRLTSIVIPASVENVSVNAFASCDKLKRVTILGEIPIIKADTFSDCPALEEITIPESVMVIEENAFSACAALKDVYFTGTESMWREISVDGGNNALENATIHYDTSPEAAYRINGITISDNDGKSLSAIPNGSFLATVSVSNRTSGTSPVVFLAAYSKEGKFQDFAYVTVKEPVGATVEVTLPIDNSAGNIAQLKAFAVSSIGGYTPVGTPVSYP